MSKFKRGNQKASFNDRNKKTNGSGYEKKESLPTITLVNRFIDEIKRIINSVNEQSGNIEYSVIDTKREYGQISIRVNFMKGDEVSKTVDLYYNENTRSKSGEYFNAFVMVTHGSSGAALFSRFGRADDLITKLIPYADRIITTNAGLKYEAEPTE